MLYSLAINYSSSLQLLELVDKIIQKSIDIFWFLHPIKQSNNKWFLQTTISPCQGLAETEHLYYGAMAMHRC